MENREIDDHLNLDPYSLMADGLVIYFYNLIDTVGVPKSTFVSKCQ